MPTRIFGGRPTTKEERQLAIRISAIFAVPMALIMVIPLIFGFAVYRHETESRLKEDRRVIARVERERIERSAAINEFVYQQCINSEIRDVVMKLQFEADIRLVKQQFPPSAAREGWIQVRRDGIAALEPPNEADCTPPPAVKQEGKP